MSSALSEKKKKMIYAHVADEKLSAVGGRLSFLREARPGEKEENSCTINCFVCNTEIKILKRHFKDCDRFWCGTDCYNKQPWEFPDIARGEKAHNIQTAEKACPKCGGPARGRGFVHTEECEEVKKKFEKRSCPECGGPAKGRGFNHIGECSLKTQPYVPVKERTDDEQQ